MLLMLILHRFLRLLVLDGVRGLSIQQMGTVL